MTPSDLSVLFLRSLRRKSPMTELELIMAAKSVFGTECGTDTAKERLVDMVDQGLLTREVDSDNVLPTTYSLTTKGAHKAKNLG